MNSDDLYHSLDHLARQIALGRSMVPAVMARIRETEARGKSVDATHSIRRWRIRSALGLAASVILLVVAAAMFIRPHVGFAAVLKKVGQSRTLIFEIPGDDPRVTRVFIRNPGLLRLEEPDGQVIVWNQSTGRALQLDPKSHQAFTSQYARQPFDLYAVLRDFKDGREKRIGERTIDGHRAIGFTITRDLPRLDQSSAREALTLWVNPDTGFPVEATLPDPDSGQEIRLTHLQFDPQLPDRLFDTRIPLGYTVHDNGGIASEKLKQPATTRQSEDLVLKPGIGIGNLAFGASREMVIQVLGNPEDSALHGLGLSYPSKGLSLLLHPKSGLVNITALSRRAAAPFAMNDFPGRTDKGIVIGAIRSDVEAVYGKPQSVQELDAGRTSLRYPKLGLTFIFFDGRVGEILLAKIRAPASAPAHAVSAPAAN